MTPSRAEYPVEEIPVDRISVFISRKREEAGRNELIASIRKHGLIIPVTVLRRADGTYELIKGQGRLEAHRRLKRASIRAFVVPESDMNPYEKTVEWLVENRVRVQLPAVVKARLADIDRQRGLTYEEIGRRYGMSPGTARQYARAAQKSSEHVLDMVQNDRLDFTQAKTIAEGIDDKGAQVVVAQVVADDRLDIKNTRAAVRVARDAIRSSGQPLTITELRSSIKQLARRRGQLGEQLVVTQERLEVLRRHTDDLVKVADFQAALTSAGRPMPPEE